MNSTAIEQVIAAIPPFTAVSQSRPATPISATFDAILSHKSAARVPGVSQQLATMLMLFDRLVTGQVVPMNPAAAVPRLNHVVNTGKALVLEAAKSTPAVILRDLRDRALLATLTYFFGRITALKMRVDVHS